MSEKEEVSLAGDGGGEACGVEVEIQKVVAKSWVVSGGNEERIETE